MILRIYHDLLQKRKVTRKWLSKKYELSTRTISRYIGMLAESGVPIQSKPGNEGGYCLPKDYLLESHSFNDNEWDRIEKSLHIAASEFSDDITYGILEKIKAEHEIEVDD